MEDILQRVFSIIIATIIFFLLPLYMAFEKKDDIAYSMALRITSNFVDNVTNKGYISKKMYLDYVSNLAMTGNMYDISILHTAKKYYPTIYASKVESGVTNIEELEYNSSNINKYKKFKNGEDVTFNNINTYKQNTNNTLDLNYKLYEIYHTEKEILANCEGELSTVGQTYTIDGNFVYPMSKGDEFTVVIKNTNTTIASILFNALTMGINDGNDTKVYINYGGSIQNESYRKNILIGESTDVEDTKTESEEAIVKPVFDIVMNISHPVGDKYGDANDDGIVDIADVLAIQRFVLKLGNASIINTYASDINFNGMVDEDDVRLLNDYVGQDVDNILNRIENPINNEISFYLKMNYSLSESNDKNTIEGKIKGCLALENCEIKKINNKGKYDGYYVYEVVVQNYDYGTITFTIKDGLLSDSGVKYKETVRKVGIVKKAKNTIKIGDEEE